MRKIRFWLTIAALLLVLTGCEFSYEGVDYTSEIMETISPPEDTESDESPVETTETPEIIDDDKTVEATPRVEVCFEYNPDFEDIFASICEKYPLSQNVMDVYKEVLFNQMSFCYKHGNVFYDDYQNDYDETLYLEDYYLDFFSDPIGIPITFAVVDMDGDGIPEIVVDANLVDRMVFHFYDGNAVFAYDFSYRQMHDIRKDGSFSWSGGAFFHGYGRLKFYSKSLDSIDLDVYDYEQDPPKFYINGVEVTGEEMKAYEIAQFEKEDVDWYQLMEISH